MDKLYFVGLSYPTRHGDESKILRQLVHKEDGKKINSEDRDILPGYLRKEDFIGRFYSIDNMSRFIKLVEEEIEIKNLSTFLKKSR